MKTSTRLCFLSASLLCMFFIFNACGADRTWTGAGDDARWANPQNWSDNTVPSGNGDQAFFPPGTPTACLVDMSMSIKCIYFRNPGMTLTISNSVNLHFDNRGGLTIQAMRSLTAKAQSPSASTRMKTLRTIRQAQERR